MLVLMVMFLGRCVSVMESDRFGLNVLLVILLLLVVVMIFWWVCSMLFLLCRIRLMNCLCWLLVCSVVLLVKLCLFCRLIV